MDTPIWNNLKLFLLFFLCFEVALNAYAQQEDWEDFLNNWTELIPSDEANSYDLERLEEMHAHPININQCSREELMMIPMLSAAEADSLLQYRRKYGPLLSAGELRLVPSLRYNCYNVIPHFVYFGQTSEDEKKHQLPYQFLHGNQEVAAVAAIPFYRRQGFKTTVKTSTGETVRPKYVGSPLSGSLRYRNHYSDRLQVGWTLENDDGEAFATQENRLFDYYSFYLLQRNKGWLGTWAVGDYKIHWGMGLTTGVGFMNSGMGLLSSRHGHAPGVFAHTGTDEYRYLRGGAVELNFRPAKLTLFTSLRELDGRLEGDSLKSINTSGYHRLLLDRKRKHNTQQQVAGGSVDFQFRQIHFGLSGLYIHYNHPFMRGDRPYQQYLMKGSNFANASLHYSYERRKISFSGETAVSGEGSMALLHDLRWQLPSFVHVYLQHRYYGKYYQAPLSYAYSASSSCRGEHGVMLGLQWQPFGKWYLAGYADGYRLLTPTYHALTPSNGYKLEANAIFRPWNNTAFSLRYRLNSRQESTTKHPQLHYAMKHSVRLQGEMQWGKVRSVTALDGCYYKPAVGRPEKGAMVSERVSVTWKQLKAAAALVAFHTQSYDASIYSYQPKLLYAYSYSFFYYHGYAATCTLEQRLGRHLRLACKFSALHYTNRETISSSDRLIAHPYKHDLVLQVRWMF